MGKININGKTYTGNNISIVGNKVTIDGVVQGEESGVVEVRIIEGKVENLITDASVVCNDVGRHVSAGGSVNCDDIGGSVNCGGSVRCDDVGGSIRHG